MDADSFERQLYLERYKADRAHELELEMIAGGLERAVLQVAGLLNGASATVFLSFLGSTADKVKVSAGLLTATFAWWLLGLLISILSGVDAYAAQQHFIAVYRSRRHEGGLKVSEAEYRKASGVQEDHGPDYFVKRAGERYDRGEGRWGRAKRFGTASVILFALGAIFALATVLSAAPVKHP